jgi:hypothetical protein
MGCWTFGSADLWPKCSLCVLFFLFSFPFPFQPYIVDNIIQYVALSKMPRRT